MQHEKIQYYLNPDPCGHVEKAPLKKVEVNFTNEVMEVKMFLDRNNYLVKVANQNFQAYCSHDKHVGRKTSTQSV